MMKVLKVKKDGPNRVAWCDDGIGYFIHPDHPVKVGQELDPDIHFLKTEIEKLKQTIKDLTTHGNKTSKYRGWILGIFEEHDEVPVWKLKAAAKERGFSWQMVSKTRAAEFDDEIAVTHSQKKGWCWKDMRGKKIG